MGSRLNVMLIARLLGFLLILGSPSHGTVAVDAPPLEDRVRVLERGDSRLSRYLRERPADEPRGAPARKSPASRFR